MIRVILRTGKVVRYNTGTFVHTSDSHATVRTQEKTTTFLAMFPWDVIERIEGRERPCSVTKESPGWKKRIG